MLYCGKDSDSLTDLKYLKYMNMASSLKATESESLHPAKKRAAVSRILGVFPTLRNKHTHGKYPTSKRLRVEVSRCLFDASHDR